MGKRRICGEQARDRGKRRGADETDTTEKHENPLSSSARGQVSVGVGRSPGLRVNAFPRPSRSCRLQWLSEGARRSQLRGQPRFWAEALTAFPFASRGCGNRRDATIAGLGPAASGMARVVCPVLRTSPKHIVAGGIESAREILV